MSSSLDQIGEDSIFQIGKVISVKGRTIEIKVDKTKNGSHLIYKGQMLKNISVGGYVKIIKGFTIIIGKVEGEIVTEDKFFSSDTDYRAPKQKIDRVLTVSLLGFFEGDRFERGIKELPLIDNECFLLHKEEFERIHQFVGQKDTPIEIGTLSFEPDQAIAVGVNSLFASHIGIFGNTGSGKSYTLAKIYRELFLKFKDSVKFKANAQFFIVDFNGEYSNPDEKDIIVERAYKNVYNLSTRVQTGDKFPIAEAALKDPDFWIVFLEATEKTQAPFLRRSVKNEFLAGKVQNAEQLKSLLARTVNAALTEADKSLDKGTVTAFIQELRDTFPQNESLQEILSDFRVHLKYHTQQYKFYWEGDDGTKVYSDSAAFIEGVIAPRLEQVAFDVEALSSVDAIRLQIIFQYYDDIIRGFANREHLAPLIKRLDHRINDLKKVVRVGSPSREAQKRNITIISLRDVNVHMRKILPLLLCKKLYSDKKEEANEDRSLNLIVDEAHNILSEDSERESAQWKDYRLETFEEIIKEGRKFGVFLTIASQRPSDISPTIISQLHNYFIHRLINNEDISAIKQTISYLDRVSFEYVPLLPTGTCILAGLLASVPIVLDVGQIVPSNFEPKNKTVTLTDKW